TLSGDRSARPSGSLSLLYRQCRESLARAGSTETRAGRRIETCAVRLAFDLSRIKPEAAIADVDRLGAMGTDIEVGVHRSRRVQHRESFAPRAKRETNRSAPAQLGELEQLHLVGTQGISRPPARRLAARAITNSRSESRFKWPRASGGPGPDSAS